MRGWDVKGSVKRDEEDVRSAARGVKGYMKEFM